MTVKDLETKLAELKKHGKITDDSHILNFNDEFGEFYETHGIHMIADDQLCSVNHLQKQIAYFQKLNLRSEVVKNQTLLDNITTVWKDAIIIN